MPTVEPMWEAILKETKNKPYAFVVMPFEKRYGVFQLVKGAVGRAVGPSCSCIRADDIKASGYDLLGMVQMAIARAQVVIVDISEARENVLYELGYATGIGKQVILITEKGAEPPTNLKGLRLIEYDSPDNRDKAEAFANKLQAELQSRVDTRLALLSNMLLGEAPLPAYICAHPKYPSRDALLRREVYNYQTFGDDLGILGLLSAFGAMFGETKDVELFCAQYYESDLLDRDVNLYLIGSSKVNRATPEMLKKLVGNREPKWVLGPAPEESDSGQDDSAVSLWRTERGKTEEVKGEIRESPLIKGGWVYTEDYGIIVRGPHPYYPHRLALVMAGAHSVGSGAACLAATKSPLIEQIKHKLPEGALANNQCTFWVLVRGKMNGKGMLDMEDVSIQEAGVYTGT